MGVIYMGNKNSILKYIKSQNITFPLSEDDFLKIIFKKDIIRKILANFTINKRRIIINTADMGRVERFIYTSYANHYYLLKKNSEEGKPTKKLYSRQIKSNIKLYFKNYTFRLGFNKKMKKLKNKAYYDVFGNSENDLN